MNEIAKFYELIINIEMIFGNILLIFSLIIFSLHTQIIKNQNLNIKILYQVFRIFYIGFFTLVLFLIIFNQIINEIISIFTMILVISLEILKYITEPHNIPDINLKKPDLKKKNNGKINIGTIFHQKKYFKSFNLNLEDIKRHMIIYGQTGTGKTSFLKNLLMNLNKKYPKIPFLLFEFKGEYNDLQNFIATTNIIKPGTNFEFNLFNNDIFPKDIYIEVLFDSLKSCQIIDNNADFSPQMEKVLIDVLTIICSDEKIHSWESLFKLLDIYSKKNERKIPLIKQTIISIKNRLRRYSTGSLSKLFCFTDKSKKISDLLKKNCIIDLGNIMKLGGSKEDVIFFANLVLKWIWESNMKKKATNKLNHITIFEDISYIASKKILDSSKLTSYLEDIALLLRGKGEALVSLTTTLDISRNIILNSGTKFFFKFNEKIDDVIHFLGIQNSSQLDINKLNIGYCLAKIDSIPHVFLLKTNLIKKKKKKVISIINNYTKKKKTNNIIQNQYLEKKRIINNNNKIEKIQDLYKLTEHLFLTENYQESAIKIIEIYKYFKENIDFGIIFSQTVRNTKQNEIHYLDHEDCLFIKNAFSYFEELEKMYKNNSKFTSNDILKAINKIKKMISLKLNDKLVGMCKGSNEIHQNHEDDLNIGIRMLYFNSISGPEIYYKYGLKILTQEIENSIAEYMDMNIGNFNIELQNYKLLINIFEVDSLWSRGKKQLIELALIIDKKIIKDNIGLTEINQLLIQFVQKLLANTKFYYAFFLTDSDKMKKYGNDIRKESKYVKNKIISFYKLIISKIIFKAKEENFPKLNNSNISIDLARLEDIIQNLILKEVTIY